VCCGSLMRIMAHDTAALSGLRRSLTSDACSCNADLLYPDSGHSRSTLTDLDCCRVSGYSDLRNRRLQLQCGLRCTRNENSLSKVPKTVDDIQDLQMVRY
jgi:hypothetical protein